MKLQGFKKYLVVLLLLGFSGSSWAVIYTLPATLTPPSWVDEVGDDINGTGLFTPGASILTFELFDLGEETPLIPGIEFGYYSASDAADGSLEASDLHNIRPRQLCKWSGDSEFWHCCSDRFLREGPQHNCSNPGETECVRHC